MALTCEHTRLIFRDAYIRRTDTAYYAECLDCNSTVVVEFNITNVRFPKAG